MNELSMDLVRDHEVDSYSGSRWRVSFWIVLVLVGCNSSEPTPETAQIGDQQHREKTQQRDQRLAIDDPVDVHISDSGGKTQHLREDDWFEDVTDSSGVRFEYRNGRESGQFTLLETVGGGVALLDYDCDGDVDLFIAGGGRIPVETLRVTGLPGALFRNDGDWEFTDVTQPAGLASAGDYSMGCSVVDYDRDGYPDLFVSCYGRSQLYHNNGDGTFVDTTDRAGLAIDGWSTGAAWADFDRDGHADLFLVAYAQWDLASRQAWCGDRRRNLRDTCGVGRYRPAADRLLRNRGDGRFDDVSSRVGLKGNGLGLGVVAVDLNDDGWLDYYVANDTTPNHLYLGGPQLTFQETGVSAGVAFSDFGISEGGMGVDAGDFNGDGRPDLWVTNFELEENGLYRNDGEASFSCVTAGTRLAGPCRRFVGFGTGFSDFDGDGRLDLFVANGNVFYHTGIQPHRQSAFLFRNCEGNHFEDVGDRGGAYFRSPHAGRGAAMGDLDNDGADDLVVVHQNEPVSLLRNRLKPAGWIRFQLCGIHCERDAVGAAVSLRSGDRRLVRWIRGGGGYLSQFDRRVLFPIQGADPVDAGVTWPGGRREQFRDLSVGATHVLVEGRGEPE